MPSSHFDERHLRHVALAQAGQIRSAGRSGLAIFTRPLPVLAALIAIGAIAVGIRDYIQQQKANTLPRPDALAVVHPQTRTHPKKTTSAKAERLRMSATEATAAEAAADGMEKPLIGEISGDAGAKPASVMGSSPNPLNGQAARDEREAAIEPNNRTAKEHNPSAKPGTCLPLPNGTQPEDVDGPYYLGWATEYCGHDLNRASGAPKGSVSAQPKR